MSKNPTAESDESLTLTNERGKGRPKVKNMCTTTLLVMALCTAVTSAEEPYKSKHLHKAEDPDTFIIGERVYSGPQAGETLTGFTVIPPRRNHLEEEFDPVAAGLGKPHFMIFIDDSDIEEGIGAFINAAWMVDKKSKTGLAASVVVLEHEGSGATGAIQFATMGEPFWNAYNAVCRIGYAPDGRDGPGAYGLNRNFPLTILIADAEGKVLYNFPFLEIPPDVPDPHVLGALAAAVGEDRETVAAWLNNKLPDASKMQKREMKKMDSEQE